MRSNRRLRNRRLQPTAANKTKGSDPLILLQYEDEMIYDHVLHRGPAGGRSQLDEI